ncbi:thioredoxin family protein [Candidatus Woesearchaeota archaeon]|nr:thioredoxin family protein [Candidatus Woesearchaeota archaeon]
MAFFKPAAGLAALLALSPISYSTAQDSEQNQVNHIDDDLSEIMTADHSLIMISTEWCVPCREMYPDFVQAAERTDLHSDQLYFAYIEIDVENPIELPFLAAPVNGYPTLITLDEGVEVERRSGILGLNSLNRRVETIEELYDLINTD